MKLCQSMNSLPCHHAYTVKKPGEMVVITVADSDNHYTFEFYTECDTHTSEVQVVTKLYSGGRYLPQISLTLFTVQYTLHKL